jgi:uncharacterized protein
LQIEEVKSVQEKVRKRKTVGKNSAGHTHEGHLAHESHPGIIKRLRRAEGHLRSVIAMIEEGRPCIDIAPQLQAVEQAISNAKAEFIRDHIDHCLGHSGSTSTPRLLEEMKAITKYI